MATIRDRYVLDVDTKGALGSIKGIKGALGALGAAFAVSGLSSFTSSVVAATTQWERYQTVLGTLLGSQEKANRELARLKDLANSLPQDLADVTEAFVIFQRYGLDTSSEGIKNFSNIATASGKSLEQLAEALGDALTGEYERLKEFGIKVSQENGKIIARMGEDIVATAYNATELTNKLQALGNTRFGGAAEANSNTLSQSLSNLRGAAFEAQLAFGEGLKPALKEIADGMAALLRNNQDLARELGTKLGEALLGIAHASKIVADNFDTIKAAILSIIGIKFVTTILSITSGLLGLVKSAITAGSGIATLARGLGSILATIPGIGLLVRALGAFAGPIGLAVTAVTTLAAAFSALAPKQVEINGLTTTYGEIGAAAFWKVKTIVIDLAKSVKDTLGAAFISLRDKLTNWAQPFISALNDILNGTYKLVNIMIGLFAGLYEQITTGIKDLPKIFIAALTATLNVIGNFVSRAGNQIKELWDYIASAGSDAIENSFTGLSNTINEELAKIGESSSVDWDKALNTDYIAQGIDAITAPLRVMVEGYREATAAVTDTTAAMKEQTDAAEAAAEAAAKLAEKVRAAADAERETQRKNLEGYAQARQNFIEEYNFRTGLINLTDEQRELEEQKWTLQRNLITAILPLQQRIVELQKQGTEESKAQIAVIEQTISAMRSGYTEGVMLVEAMVEARNKELNIQKQQQSIEAARKSAAEAVLEVQERIRQAQEGASLIGLSGINKELKQIELNELKAARAAKARITAQLEEGVDASVIAGELAKIDAMTAQSIARQQDIAKSAYENSRMFSTGWKQAFEEYQENATNAANQARRIFEKSTKGMEDAIVGFAKTGKFEWKGFVNSILEELLRSQVQQLIAKTFGMLGGGGGSGGGKGLFGGFFATGGMIPPGRFGVVGENGPELVSGPANVTPNLGGGNVTYNINAVDAMSFKQMIAQDPSFLYAVTEQGKRSLPQTRR